MYFYVWVPIVIIIIVLITASAVSKMRMDRKSATANRAVANGDVLATRISGANNTVIYTIPSRSIHDTWVIGDSRTPTNHLRFNEQLEDAPPSYDQVLGSPQTAT